MVHQSQTPLLRLATGSPAPNVGPRYAPRCLGRGGGERHSVPAPESVSRETHNKGERATGPSPADGSSSEATAMATMTRGQATPQERGRERRDTPELGRSRNKTGRGRTLHARGPPTMRRRCSAPAARSVELGGCGAHVRRDVDGKQGADREDRRRRPVPRCGGTGHNALSQNGDIRTTRATIRCEKVAGETYSKEHRCGPRTSRSNRTRAGRPLRSRRRIEKPPTW